MVSVKVCYAVHTSQCWLLFVCILSQTNVTNYEITDHTDDSLKN